MSVRRPLDENRDMERMNLLGKSTVEGRIITPAGLRVLRKAAQGQGEPGACGQASEGA